jgi:transcriptional activator SPT7
MAPWVNRAALQRSVGKIFYHAGFEDFQPSAMEAMTDVATEFMAKIGASLKLYNELPTTDPTVERISFDEQVLHTLDDNGIDLESLETYIRDDVERLSTKLGVVHERMKSHLADLLVSSICRIISLSLFLLTQPSGPLWATMPVRTELVRSTMVVISLLAAISQKIWTRTSLASVSSA